MSRTAAVLIEPGQRLKGLPAQCASVRQAVEGPLGGVRLCIVREGLGGAARIGEKTACGLELRGYGVDGCPVHMGGVTVTGLNVRSEPCVGDKRPWASSSRAPALAVMRYPIVVIESIFRVEKLCEMVHPLNVTYVR